MSLPLLPTTVVGSYPQPDWLVDHKMLLSITPPRVRLEQVWRQQGALREATQDDATRLAIRDMEDAGIDIVTDGEIRRESYFNIFATALGGIDIDHPATMLDRAGAVVHVPRVIGPIKRLRPVHVRDTQFLRAATTKPIKITLPGPFTMSQLAADEHYGDESKLAMAYAEAVNEELKDIKSAGCDFAQIDEPYLQAKPDKARRFGVAVIDRALAGIEGSTIVHVCSDMLMLSSLSRPAIRSFRSSTAAAQARFRSRPHSPSLIRPALLSFPPKNHARRNRSCG